MSDFAIASPDVSATPQTPIRNIGILGGGQLAWMLSEVAPSLGLNLYIQTPNVTDSALQQIKHLREKAVLAPIADATATAQLAQHCQVITFENEFVDLEALEKLAATGVCFRPSLGSLAPLLDKYVQRTFLASLGLPVPEFAPLETRELPSPFEFPVAIKTRRHGYDGHGTFICHMVEDLDQCWQQAESDASVLMVEAYVPFERELAMMAARSPTGEISLFPVVETVQRHQVCHWTMAPVQLSSTTQKQIDHIATQILEHLDIVGIVGIELFQTVDDQIWVNEIAPRTHNSGHLTIDACATSQFEQHLRAISGQPLGPTHLTSPAAVMVNLLGFETAQDDYRLKRQAIAALPHTRVHWYGKTAARPGRKLGHATILLSSDDPALAVEMAHKVEALWYGD
ncbi:5-(carboxyamino)imidazole ribonucleotide synthase [Acaryochloris sp. IP29b_bin.137]|uniref:5-(carboxyamino)imidazole ribonucleotide synthase n=1 Tax=Acaryochloris sp. IP29b_bin.137 TaxID=2969217 RepID=UPI0026395BC2|nr:5-(carboxyamino)imidazole ribonucleotide synthase [Acaryochloris sp. IP29b_bin.137]